MVVATHVLSAGELEATFSPANAWFVLHFAGGGSFRVPAVVPGIRQFLEACERHLKPEQLRAAKGGYPLAGRAWPFVGEAYYGLLGQIFNLLTVTQCEDVVEPFQISIIECQKHARHVNHTVNELVHLFY